MCVKALLGDQNFTQTHTQTQIYTHTDAHFINLIIFPRKAETRLKGGKLERKNNREHNESGTINKNTAIERRTKKET